MLDTFKIQMKRFLAVLSRSCFWQERLNQMILDVPSNWVFYDSMTYFALKVIGISGSLQQSLHTITSLLALRAIEDSVAFMCICHPCHF